MARIPDATTIQRKVASGQRTVRGIDTRNFAPKELGAALTRIADKHEKREYSKAEYELNSLKNKEDNSYSEDADYKTIPDRYSKNMSKGLGEISMGISSPSARAEFIQRNKLKIEQGQERIKKVAFGKERDYERSYNTKALKDLREQSITGEPDDVISSRETVKGLFDSGVEMGYYTQEEADNEINNWRTSAAVGRLEMMQPEDRINFLKTEQAKHLPSDVRTKLTSQAEEATFAQKAVDTVDEYLIDDMDRGEAMLSAGKIKDERLRKEVERRFDYQYGKQKEFETEEKSEIYEKYYLDVREGDLTVDDIPSEEFRFLSPSQQNNLLNAQSNSVGKSRTVSDRTVVDSLYGLKQKGQFRELREFFIANSSELNETDYKNWSQVSQKGAVPVEVESFFTNTQLLNQKISGAKITDKDEIGQYHTKFGDWYMGYQETNEKKPTDKEVTEQMDHLLMSVPTDVSYFGFDEDEIPLFKATEKDLTNAINEIKNDDPKNAKVVVEYFKLIGNTGASNIDLIKYYNSIKDDDDKKIMLLKVKDISQSNPKVFNKVISYFKQKGIQTPEEKDIIRAYNLLK